MKHAIFAVASAVLALHTILGPGSIAKADSITTSITQDGGTFTNSSGTLLIGSTDQSSPAVLTLKNGAVTSGITEIQVGAFPDNMFGNLELLSGSSLTNSGDGYIGIKRFVFTGPIPSGLVTVSGIGSKWSNTGALIIGGNGSGSLNIADGGQVSNNSSLVGGFSYAPSTSSVSVSGAGSKWTTTNDLSIGGVNKDQLSQSNVSVTDSGLMEVGGTLNIGYKATVTLDGGIISTKTFVNEVGTFHFYDGVLTIDGGGLGVGDFAIDGNTAIALPKLKLIDGANATSSDELTIGKANRGEVEVMGGSHASHSNVYLGFDQSGNGEILVTNPSSTWNAGQFFVGYGGNGDLTISDQGNIQCTMFDIASLTDSVGTTTVSGENSALSSLNLAVGNGGTGTLLVSEGAHVGSLGSIVGNLSNSEGIVTIDGEGSKWVNYWSMAIGERGKGTITIVNGGELGTGNVTDHSETYVGYYSGSSGTIEVIGKGSNWTNAWNLSVGDGGYGAINLREGGVATTHAATLGYSKNSYGNVTVEGLESKWTIESNLEIGDRGTGILKVLGGAHITSGFSSIGGADSEVVISGSDSEWKISDKLYLALFPFEVGQLIVEDGGTLHIEGSDGMLIGKSGTLTGNGGTIIGNVNSSGLVSPGSSPGIMTIDGNYTQQTAGELHIELAGLGQGTKYDYLHITGLTTLSGLLTLDILDGFEDSITSTDTFTILTSDGGLTGEFTNLDLHHRLNARWGSFLVSYESNSVVLSDFVAVPEPGSLLLAAMGVAGFVVAARRRMSRIS